jgi:hypothetical protein
LEKEGSILSKQKGSAPTGGYSELRSLPLEFMAVLRAAINPWNDVFFLPE